jgi:hypothetical protein
MNHPTNHPPQFSLTTLFIGVTGSAVVCATSKLLGIALVVASGVVLITMAGSILATVLVANHMSQTAQFAGMLFRRVKLLVFVFGAIYFGGIVLSVILAK